MPISSKVDGPVFFGGAAGWGEGWEDIVCCWRGLGDALFMPDCPGELALECIGECIGLADENLSGRWFGGLSMGFTGVMELFRSGRGYWLAEGSRRGMAWPPPCRDTDILEGS